MSRKCHTSRKTVATSPQRIQQLLYWKRLSLLQRLSFVALFSFLPLLAGIVFSLKQLNDVSVQQQHLLSRSITLTRAAIDLSDQIKELERTAHQAVIFADQRFLRLYEEKQQAFQRIANRFSVEPQLADLDPLFASIRTLIEHSKDTIESQTNDQTRLGNLSAAFGSANDLSLQVHQRVKEWLGKETQAHQQTYQRIETFLMFLGLLILPLCLVIAWLAASSVSKPLTTISHEIRRIGQGDWHTSIDMSGPEDFVELGKRLEWLRHQLLEIEQYKQSLLRNITHELKTPLASVKEAASLLQDEIPGPTNEQQQQVLHLLLKNVDALHAMINELLVYNAVSLDKAVHHEPVVALDLLNSIKDQFHLLLTQKHIHLKLECGNFEFHGDKARISLIINNLLSNAIKHSNEHSDITISLSKSSSQLILAIEDNGIGIAECEHDDIFKPLYKSKNNVGQSNPGSGVGLAIVKECVNTLHGSVTVQSTEGEGSCFTVNLPLMEKEGI